MEQDVCLEREVKRLSAMLDSYLPTVAMSVTLFVDSSLDNTAAEEAIRS